MLSHKPSRLSLLIGTRNFQEMCVLRQCVHYVLHEPLLKTSINVVPVSLADSKVSQTRHETTQRKLISSPIFVTQNKFC